ncbi:hypothetical protein [Paenibacillus arenosi]|uniref:Uncharacterized protein n=1 Tax=Paenibacillus arenosi TaxID=2774142 RepID=A0ABR9AWV6_9BACL|nr:hypothetical protein [Paenibacillus arenosi]MBD8498371.1 hypothetical protein [Paenibacillus arenosi]
MHASWGWSKHPWNPQHPTYKRAISDNPLRQLLWQVVIGSRGGISYEQASGMTIEELCEAAAALEWMLGKGGG